MVAASAMFGSRPWVYSGLVIVGRDEEQLQDNQLVSTILPNVAAAAAVSAPTREHDADVLQQLLEAGADRQALNRDGHTAPTPPTRGAPAGPR